MYAYICIVFIVSDGMVITDLRYDGKGVLVPHPFTVTYVVEQFLKHIWMSDGDPNVCICRGGTWDGFAHGVREHMSKKH